MSPLELLKSRFAEALAGLADNPAEYLDLIRVSQNPKFGDYQANIAMPLAKKLGQNPRQVAQAMIDKLRWDDILEKPEIAGPGFINLRFKTETLEKGVLQTFRDDRLGVSKIGNPRTYVLDYSAPNAAKPMHVGHIRSTCIGNALNKILRFVGHHVISDSHLGDWGTQFGMIFYGWRHFLDREAYEKNPVEELARLYRLVRQKADADPAVMAEVLNETSKLHHGDAENLELWRSVLPHCRDEINRVYQRLNIEFDYMLGESFYNDRLGPLTEKLRAAGQARESQGALCIFLEGEEVPMLIRKKDGAFLYATTDLATLEYRREEFHPDAILYVVDFRQSLHFQQLFKAARQLGLADEKTELVHVKFGTVLGDDGKAFKTRSGETVGLESLLDEAERRALAVIIANDKEGALSESERLENARVIGIGALLYADLSQNRDSDYVFSFDKMLAMNGNTATYMQYAFARIRSIFTKGNVDPQELRRRAADGSAPLLLREPAERALALELLKFSDAVYSVLKDYRPNMLTSYLFDLAGCYSAFFEKCPVLKAETDEIKTGRLLLCDRTAETIRLGLSLLGIGTVEKM
ncbi:MAG: arginine--tRNA ligase [Thermoguttaceae bacterium]|nr:arginine--tRNA ligase [Thermoguttaceae bacterium]